MSDAVDILVALPGIARAFANDDLGEVVLEAVAVDKQAFDSTVMTTIQSEWSVVRCTRTFLVINSMRWHRGGPPTPLQSLLAAPLPICPLLPS